MTHRHLVYETFKPSKGAKQIANKRDCHVQKISSSHNLYRGPPTCMPVKGVKLTILNHLESHINVQATSLKILDT